MRPEILVCEKHDEPRVRDSQGKLRCRSCTAELARRRRLRIKRALVDHKGGACERCGYSKSLRALGFHHRDPSRKEFSIARANLNSLARLLREIEKCDLLCANCHMEIEDDSKGG